MANQDKSQTHQPDDGQESGQPGDRPTSAPASIESYQTATHEVAHEDSSARQSSAVSVVERPADSELCLNKSTGSSASIEELANDSSATNPREIFSFRPGDISLSSGQTSRLQSPMDGCRQCVSSSGDCCHPSGQESKLEVSLLYTSIERLKLKDFRLEVRAAMDVEQFVHQAELVLDMREASVEDIVRSMLDKVMGEDRVSSQTIEEAKRVVLVPDSTRLLARTIQGISSYVDAQGGSVTSSSYDQSWLCALCSLVQVSRRHMVIARFCQPTNMADSAREVRLFALMLTPSKEKNTKGALETGRTFATMLTDPLLRQQLLAAKDEVEFKSLMMVAAKRLSQAKMLKNRHKYQLAPAIHHSISSLSSAGHHQQAANQSVELGGYRNTPLGDTLDAASGANQTADYDAISTENAKRRASMSGWRWPALEASLCLGGGSPPAETKGVHALSQLVTNNSGSLTANEVGFLPAAESQKPKGMFLPNIRAADHNDPESGKLSLSLYLLDSGMEFGRGLMADLRRRLAYYPSDFKDAFVGPKNTVHKTVATVWFLYFGILLPTIAFSALNTSQTQGHMGDLRKAIVGQAVGGLCFALLGGQPLVIIMTTAPLCLYTKVIHRMSVEFGFHFPLMYAAVGLWNGLFLAIYSLLGFSRIMKWCTRSTEEIFALFIVIAFITDAGKDLAKNFQKHYYSSACGVASSLNGTSFRAAPDAWSNSSVLEMDMQPDCSRETSLLFLMLMLGTLWLATSLYRFKKTPYLEAAKRELLADYALPAAVITMSFVGSYVFEEIYVEKFPPIQEIKLERAQVELLPLSGLLMSMGLGFTLSLLFFMDQNISAAMVNAPQNGLKKGCAYHLDLMIVGVLNAFLTLYGFPMMHGVLPHSPLHVRSLADIEERVEEGHLCEVITNVRENRVTGVISHLLVLASLLLIPYPIAYIPTSVLNGLFLYMAVTSLDGLQMFERILLVFTEQSKYPPNHYIRRCPQRKIHQFTAIQTMQLLVMCLFGFSPLNEMKMFFPVIIFLMIPFRHQVVSKLMDEKYLDALDGKH